MKKCKLKLGDKVAYAASFIRSIGGSREMAQGRGIVQRIIPVGTQTYIAEIDWQGADLPPRVNVQNLAKIGSAAFGDCATRPNNIE